MSFDDFGGDVNYLDEPLELPCGHAVCGGRLQEVRDKCVTKACPLCRAKLPPTPAILCDDGITLLARAQRIANTDPPEAAALREEATELFRAAAVQGEPRGMTLLASCYDWGVTSCFDEQQAIELYEQAIESGDLNAMVGLACKLNNRGLAADSKRAIELLNRAVERSSAAAAYNLGLYYSKGHPE